MYVLLGQERKTKKKKKRNRILTVIFLVITLTMCIEVRNRILLITSILVLFIGVIHTYSSKHSPGKAQLLIESICENLYDDNKDWAKICDKWAKTIDHEQRDPMNDEINYHRPRIFGSRSSSRSSSSSRISTGGSRTSGSRTSGSRISIPSRFRNSRTGTVISRPTGWLWSRTRHVFLPVSRRYYYRSTPIYSRTTRPPPTSITYYYCTSNTSNPNEIQCSTVNDDTQCCEDETNQQIYCCGGKIDDDLKEDFNQATQIIARIFFTLSAMALFMHIFMNRLPTNFINLF